MADGDDDFIRVVLSGVCAHTKDFLARPIEANRFSFVLQMDAKIIAWLGVGWESWVNCTHTHSNTAMLGPPKTLSTYARRAPTESNCITPRRTIKPCTICANNKNTHTHRLTPRAARTFAVLPPPRVVQAIIIHTHARSHCRVFTPYMCIYSIASIACVLIYIVDTLWGCMLCLCINIYHCYVNVFVQVIYL